MPKSNLKAVISFGLVSIPVVLYNVENKTADIHFHQIDKRDNARIRYQRVNENTGKVVSWENITRGYLYDKDLLIPVPDEVLTKVAGDEARVIDIELFIDKAELDLLSIDHSYYTVPDKKADKGYVILREALKDSKKIGIAKVIISTKEYLAAIMPHDTGLILSLLKYDNEVRKMSELNFPDKEISSYKVNKKEIEIAKKLINSMSYKWKPEKYKDDYQEAIHQWVEESVKHLPHTLKKKKSFAEKGKIVDFMTLLKKSLASSGKVNKKEKAKYSPKVEKTKSSHRSYVKH